MDRDGLAWGRCGARVRVAVGVATVGMATVGMATVVAIGTAFGFKGFGHGHHRQVHRPEHLGQHVVGLDFQVVGLEFDGHMAVAQVVGRAGQVKGRTMLGAGGDAQHVLRRSFDADQRAVFGHQHIAAAHHRTTRQEHPQRTALAVGRIKAAFLAGVPVQGEGVGALDQHAGQALALGHEFGAGEHQNKK